MVGLTDAAEAGKLLECSYAEIRRSGEHAEVSWEIRNNPTGAVLQGRQ